MVFFWWTRDRWLVLACTFGAVLPDLVDKPVGLMFLNGSLYLSRTYFHTLLFLLIVLALGILVWHRTRSFLGIGVAAGMFSHQMLDLMYRAYWNWLWPFYGQFRGGAPEEYLLSRLYEIFTNPVEGIVGLCVILVCLLVFFKGDMLESGTKSRIIFLSLIAAALVVAGVLFLGENSAVMQSFLA